MSSEQFALVPVMGHERHDEELTSTVFGQFLQAVRARQTPNQTILLGKVVWRDEPVETIILSGIWKVMEARAEILDESLSTTARAEAMARRVNRRVSAGIVFVYATPEVAASAFHTNVIQLVRRAHALGYRPGMNLPLSAWKSLRGGDAHGFARQIPKTHDASRPGSLIEYWQAASSLFFADLVRAARLTYERLTDLYNQFARANTVSSDTSDIFIISRGELVKHIALSAIRYLDEISSDSPEMPDGIATTEAVLLDAIASCGAFQAFRLNRTSWSDRCVVSLSVDDEWLATQIILAHANADPDTDVISGLAQYHEALCALQEANLQTALARTWGRLNGRARRTLTGHEREIVDKRITAHVNSMKEWDANSITQGVLDRVLIVVNDREVVPNHETALEIATGREISLVEQMRNAGVDMKSWLENVAGAILWGELRKKDVVAIARVQLIPHVVVIDNLAQCKDDVARAAVDAIMRKDPQPPALNKLVAMGLVEMTPSLLAERLDDLDPDVLGSSLVAMLSHARSKGDKAFMGTFCRALGRATQESARALVDDKDSRFQLCKIGGEILTDSDIPFTVFDQVRVNLGEERYRMFVLGSIALDIDSIRACGERGRVSLSWKNVFSRGSDVSIPLRVLGASATEAVARQLLHDVPEKMVRAWVGLDKVDK
jgi:hypothetical protein